MMTGSNAACGDGARDHPGAMRTALALLLACGVAAGVGRARTAELRPQEESREVREFSSERRGPEELPRLIAQLDDPEFMKRQEASAAIITDDRITIAMIERALAADDLSPEQRQRLRHAQKHRFETTPRAGMGVQFATQLLPHRVVLNATIPPFKSTELLQTGDIIESAGGVNLRSTRAFDLMRMVIISHDPGDELPIVVRRGEERLELSVPLGRYSDLNNTVALDPADLERAWRVRLNRTPDPDRELIDPGVPMDDWQQMEDDSRQRRSAREAAAARAGLGAVPPRIVIAGGEPRPPFFDEGEFSKLMVIRDKDELRFEDLQLIRQQQAEQQRLFAAMQTAPTTPPMPLADEIARVRAVAEQTRAELERLRNEAAAGRPINPQALDQHENTLLAADRALVVLLSEQEQTQQPATNKDP